MCVDSSGTMDRIVLLMRRHATFAAQTDNRSRIYKGRTHQHHDRGRTHLPQRSSKGKYLPSAHRKQPHILRGSRTSTTGDCSALTVRCDMAHTHYPPVTRQRAIVNSENSQQYRNEFPSFNLDDFHHVLSETFSAYGPTAFAKYDAPAS